MRIKNPDLVFSDNFVPKACNQINLTCEDVVTHITIHNPFSESYTFISIWNNSKLSKDLL